MTQLVITYHRGRPLAAYYYLQSKRGKSVRCRVVDSGLVIDYDRRGKPLGIEITAPARVTLRAFNRILRELGFPPVRRRDIAPLRAA
jgi:uncharacterized protein YuzE